MVGAYIIYNIILLKISFYILLPSRFYGRTFAYKYVDHTSTFIVVSDDKIK